MTLLGATGEAAEIQAELTTHDDPATAHADPATSDNHSTEGKEERP